ncbi:M57 family metalloprotease [Streptococcus parauberis]|uniref:M57 family metalloprotease n=1 Tax=Streptococcus parauberis TaxID=1348 RepID=UPI0039B1182E
MKKFLKIILWLPMKLIEWLFRIIWGFVQTILLLAIIFFGLIYYSNHSDSPLANQIANVTNQIVTIFNTISNSQKSSSASQHQDNDHIKDTENSKWSSNKASVYINATNPVFINAYHAAINNWNNTGAFTFTLTMNQKKANIIADQMNDSKVIAAGLAKVESQTLNHQLSSAKVYLNSYFLMDQSYGYQADRIVHTAEHELGHAIGLNHKDTKNSVMQSSGSFFGIEQTDINQVSELYQGN